MRTRFTLSVALFAGLVCGLAASDRAEARRAFTRAQEYLKERIHSKPIEKRSRKRYDHAIFLFRKVIDADPSFGGSDDALFQIARLYDEKHQRFKKGSDLRRAVYYYRFVAREYPLTKYRGDALKRARFLESPPAPPPVRRTEVPTPAPVPVLAGRPALVERIRYWSGPDYTRVVIDVDREVVFRRYTIENPYRIYFELEGARLKPGITAHHPVNDVHIKSVRAAQNRPGVVRVVLDFSKGGQTTEFPLYDPFRIVIDTHSQKAARRPRGAAAKPSSPAAPSNETVRSAEIPLEKDVPAREESSRIPIVPAPNISGDLSLTRTLGLKVGRVVIDPGHGGRDHGTVGAKGLKEKDLVLDVARRLKSLLEVRLHTDVILTRSDDRFVPLEERTAIANQKGADLFISIHANASRSSRARGVETFYLAMASTADEKEVAGRENAGSQRNIRELHNLLLQITKGDYNEESRDLAHVVQKQLYAGLKKDLTHTRNRGVKRAPFVVLIGSNMPSILAEIGFISNPFEEKYLKKSRARDRAAESLFSGVQEYFRALGAAEPVEADAQTRR